MNFLKPCQLYLHLTNLTPLSSEEQQWSPSLPVSEKGISNLCGNIPHLVSISSRLSSLWKGPDRMSPSSLQQPTITGTLETLPAFTAFWNSMGRKGSSTPESIVGIQGNGLAKSQSMNIRALLMILDAFTPCKCLRIV